MTSSAEYFVVMIDYGRAGREAIVDPEMTFRGAVERVEEAMGGGHAVPFVHRVAAGEPVEDVSEQVFAQVMANLVARGEPLSANEYEFVELHVSMQAAQSFRRAA